MTVDATEITNLLKNVDINSLLGGGKMATTDTGFGGGTLGAVLIGALLPRLLNNNGVDGVAAAAAINPLTAADVQNIVNGNTNSQTLGNVAGEIWKAEGDVQAAISAAAATSTLATLNAEIANLQGQTHLTKAITDSSSSIESGLLQTQLATLQGQGVITKAISDQGTEISSQHNITNSLVNQAATSTAAQFGALNTNVAQLGALTIQAINNDGDKTRVEIRALKDSIPNARELDLQRQLTVALDDHRHTTTRGALASGNVEVITNVNQNQAQAQQQQQLNTLSNLVGQLAMHQQATAQAINVGSGFQAASPTSTNIKS